MSAGVTDDDLAGLGLESTLVRKGILRIFAELIESKGFDS
jgi:hypothetical protein